MRVMGLDVGEKTVGISVSDELGWTAQGIEVLHRHPGSLKADLDYLQEIIDRFRIEKVIVGLPKNMNGTIGERGAQCQAFAQNLHEYSGIPVQMWDERLSTVSAERHLIEADVSRKKRKQVIDKMAAVIILQNYLDSL